MEIWKDIPWYKWIYQVSNLWNIKSLNYNNTKEEKIMRICENRDGYFKISLSNKIKRNWYFVHRLVMLTFVWESNLQVNHKNWIKSDNRLENLEYCTAKENTLHKYNVLWQKCNLLWWIMQQKWEKHPNSKRVKQFSLNWQFINEFWWLKEAERKTWISNWNISNCCNWKYKTAWWYKWKYA